MVSVELKDWIWCSLIKLDMGLCWVGELDERTGLRKVGRVWGMSGFIYLNPCGGHQIFRHKLTQEVWRRAPASQRHRNLLWLQ